MLAHYHDLRDYGIAGPIHPEDFGQLLQILSRSFSYREDGVSEPAHTEVTELLIEKVYAELAC